MKTAIVHDWLVTVAGAEKVLEQLLAEFPDADLFSLVDFLPGEDRAFIGNRPVRTSFLQRFPFARRSYRNYLAFMPLAIEQFDLSSYDLIISSSHAVAKGVLTSQDQVHICYCHTPVRYAWDLYHQYLREANLEKGIKGRIAQSILHYIRQWDYLSSQRVDHFIANSRFIAARIKKNYGREATVIYPPVDLDSFEVVAAKDDYYVTASRMVPYKKLDLIVDAFSALPDRKLVVVGDGPDFGKIKARAGRNIELVGHQPMDRLKRYLQKARAFIFAAEEDFGILPVEAQACGTPVIAFGRGGVRETVVEHATGVFFTEQAVPSLVTAVRDFESFRRGFDPAVIRRNAERFSPERFRREIRDFVAHHSTN